MAVRNVCDGNGTEIAPDTPCTGNFGHQYCDELRPVAENYLADLNALHTRCAERFTLELSELRALYHEKLAELPDAP